MKRPDFLCWPDLRVTVHPLPWCWRLRPFMHIDEVHGARCMWIFRWLAFDVEWWGQEKGVPLFPIDEVAER